MHVHARRHSCIRRTLAIFCFRCGFITCFNFFEVKCAARAARVRLYVLFQSARVRECAGPLWLRGAALWSSGRGASCVSNEPCLLSSFLNYLPRFFPISASFSYFLPSCLPLLFSRFCVVTQPCNHLRFVAPALFCGQRATSSDFHVELSGVVK